MTISGYDKAYEMVKNGSGEAALGNYTESSSPPPTENTPQTHLRQGFRANQYALQISISRIFKWDAGLLGKTTSFEEYNELPRMVKCTRTRREPSVKIRKKSNSKSAYYDGLVFCGSGWVCPCCASKIQHQRRDEIEQVVNHMGSLGKKALMVTLTIPHYSDQSAAHVWDSLTKALRGLRNGKAWVKFKERFGYEGHITAKEIMYGRNGWHPHTHELWFVDESVSSDEVHQYILKKWEAQLSKQGAIKKGKLAAFRARSVDVSCAKSDYLAKFDHDKYVRKLSNEVSLFGVKKGRSGSIHPFQLAQLATGPNGQVREKEASLFIEYYETTKGKAQLFFSRGLKKKCGIAQVDDQTIAETVDKKDQKITAFEFFGWNEVLKHNARALMLDYAEMKNGHDLIEDWLRDKGLSSYMGFD